jgi:FkbM family methyltransferase
MPNKLVLKIGNMLFKMAFKVYKLLYITYKNNEEKQEIALLQSIVKHGNTVLDIGANIGFYTKILSKAVGEQGHVLCFEPDFVNYNHLCLTTTGLPNVQIHQKAVASKTQKIVLYTSKELNVDHRTYKPEQYDQEIETDAVCIDDFLKDQTKDDVIKMDIQGFEMEALIGMTHILTNNHNIKILSEFWPYGLKMAGYSAVEYFENLTNLGFNIFMVTDKGLRLLEIGAVQGMMLLDKEHYYNIYATRNVDEISF